MPTDEERRDVARKLRKLSSQEEVSKMDVRQTVGLYMGSCRKGYSPESVLRLADLIDPESERECKMLPAQTDATCVYKYSCQNGDVFEVEFGYKRCSRCGDFCVDCESVKYCPSCGAKVVRYDE